MVTPKSQSLSVRLCSHTPYVSSKIAETTWMRIALRIFLHLSYPRWTFSRSRVQQCTFRSSTDWFPCHFCTRLASLLDCISRTLWSNSMHSLRLNCRASWVSLALWYTLASARISSSGSDQISWVCRIASQRSCRFNRWDQRCCTTCPLALDILDFCHLFAS